MHAFRCTTDGCSAHMVPVPLDPAASFESWVVVLCGVCGGPVQLVDMAAVAEAAELEDVAGGAV